MNRNFRLIVAAAILYVTPALAARVCSNGSCTETTGLTVQSGLYVTGGANIAGGITSSGQIASTVGTGTAPMTISSTTKVPNLYVDRAALSDTVTTNANLTGDVTSVGNATTYSGTVPVAKGGTGDTGTAWSTYTPTVTCSSGSLTTYTATGRYKTIGKTAHLQIAITNTTNGTCAGYWQISVPGGWTLAAAYAYSGMDFNALKSLVAGSNSGGSSVIATLYDGTYPGVSGHSYTISGVVEIQ